MAAEFTEKLRLVISKNCNGMIANQTRKYTRSRSLSRARARSWAAYK